MKPLPRAKALVPARAGSVRLPGKNMAELGGQPLIAWTIDAALKSQCFEEVVVSSDDSAVLDLVSGHKFKWAPNLRGVLRPPNLATSTATTPKVLENLADQEKWREEGVEQVWLLLPTSPFRDAQQIRSAFHELTEQWDSLVSMREFDIPLEWAFRINDEGGVMPVLPDNPLQSGKTRSQEYKTAVHPNGAIYGSWLTPFMKTGSFYQGRLKAFLMDAESSLDIDRPFDLQMARTFLDSSL